MLRSRSRIVLTLGRDVPHPGRKSPYPKSGSEESVRLVATKGPDAMNDERDLELIGLFMIRVAWLVAILGCVLAILLALLSGTDRRDYSGPLPALFSDGGSSRLLPDFLSSVPAAPLSARRTAETVAFHVGPTERAREQGKADGISISGAPDRSASQTEDVSGRAPAARPDPSPPQSQSPADRTPPPTQPSPPQGPSESPSSSSPQVPSTSPPSAPQVPSVTTSPSPKPPVSVGVSLSPPKASVTVGDTTVQLP